MSSPSHYLSGVVRDLRSQIDTTKVWCENELVESSAQRVLEKTWETRLDGEHVIETRRGDTSVLILYIPYA